jgi:ABC-type Na+ efflux pump permease subunit
MEPNWTKQPLELPPVEKERGGCLSIYLGVSLLASIVALVLFAGLASDPRARILPPSYIPVSLIIIAATAVCAYQTWNWKRWGLYGLYATMIVSNLYSMIIGVGDVGRNLLQLFVQPLILYLLTYKKMDNFE